MTVQANLVSKTHNHSWVFCLEFKRKKQTTKLDYRISLSDSLAYNIFKPAKLYFDFDSLVKRVETHVGFSLTKEEVKYLNKYFRSELPEYVEVATR